MPAAFGPRENPGPAFHGPKEKPASGYGGQVGWAVGLPSWLNSPASRVNRYWRVIEFGSAATEYPWVGQQVAGLWGDNARPRGFNARTQFEPGRLNQGFQPYFSKLGQDMLGPARAALWDFMEGGKGPNMDLLHVTEYRKQIVKKNKKGQVTRREMVTRQAHTESQMNRARRQLFFWFMTRAESAHELPFVQGTINREIPAGHYYEEALKSFDMHGWHKRALEETFAEAMGGAKLTLGNMRKDQAFDNAGERKGKGRARAFYTDESVQRLLPRSLASAAAHVQIQSLSRAQGQFVNGAWQQALREYNARIARAFQAEVVGHMAAPHRPATEFLRKATAAAENRYPQN